MPKPTGDRVIVKPETAEVVTSSGIIIPDKSQKAERGVVVSAGKVKEVKVGDKVYFSKYGYDELSIEGEAYYVLSEVNILAVYG